MTGQRIGVFCGASPGNRPGYLDSAHRLGTALAERGFGLVYGGSAGGIMGTVAQATMTAGGTVIGVIPRHLTEHDPVKADIHECHVVDTMHERKAMMYRLSDAFITLPGGLGTLDELFETLTWGKLGLHSKPVVVLNIDGYYDILSGLLDQAFTEGFISAFDRGLVRMAASADEAVDLAGASLLSITV
ncbi:MAG TPA: TIGR00730 family Rossman fold protein [Pseudonocardiaceae bacterium]|jgi:hypothetical protein